MNKPMITALVAGALLLAACAGNDFVRPDANALKNGETTVAQATRQLGPPRSDGTIVRNGKTLSYAYASSVGTAARDGIVPARALTLTFDGDVLVGQEFVSSWKEDATDFDEGKVASIAKGRSTRAEVVATMGKPSGTAIAPLVKAPATDALVYAYNESIRSGLTLRFYRKVLIVSLDDRGVVADVEYTSSGTR